MSRAPVTDSAVQPAARTGTRLANLALAALAATAILFWIAVVIRSRSNPDFWQRDWFCLWTVGRDFLAGKRSGFYTEPCSPGYMWTYPPYMIYPWSLLARLSPFTAYMTLVAVTLTAVTASLVLLSRGFRSERPFVTAGLAAMASAALSATIVTGQNSSWLLLAVSGALWSAHDDRPVATGVFIAILGFKPNWVVLFVIWLLATRRWTSLVTTASAGVLMVLSSLPLGIDLWREFLRVGGDRMAVFLGSVSGSGAFPAWKLITVEAFLRSLFGTSTVERIIWVGIVAVVLGLSARVWLRDRDARRQIAVTVLAVVAVNPYASFYDALVLVLPAVLWWCTPSSYSPRARWIVGLCIAAIWLVQWISLYGIRSDGQPSLVGGIVLVWFLAEASRAPVLPDPVATGRFS